jgi:TetR/AcrR family transcriptional regulator
MKNTNSRDTLLKCALTLFSEKGYDNAGINEIVQMAGVTKPALYYFFGSKEGLFEEILKQYYERLNSILAKESAYFPNAESYENDVLPTLLRIVNAYFAFALENKQFYMMVLSLAFAPPTAQVTSMIEPYNVAQYQIIIECFERIAKAHVNLKGKERQCAYHFIAMINANIGLWNHGYEELKDQNANAIVSQFMHGIFS